MEKIISIENCNDGDSWGGKSGYAITTDKQIIKLLIDNLQSCCEHWGYFMSEDDLEMFIGAEIIEIGITDTILNSKKLEENNLDSDGNMYEGNIMFVNISTTKGVLQFAAYNEHNGYYGHEAYVVSEQLNIEKWL